MPKDKEIFDVPLPPPPSMPLKGYLVREDSDTLWIQDFQGTWMIKKSDVLGRGEWPGVSDTRFSGKAGVFFIKDGAEIQSVRAVTVKAKRDWPLAVADAARVSEVRGLSALEEAPIENLTDPEFGIFRDSQRPRPAPRYTYCKGPDGRFYICDNLAV